jgi:hypothetical protein
VVSELMTLGEMAAKDIQTEFVNPCKLLIALREDSSIFDQLESQLSLPLRQTFPARDYVQMTVSPEKFVEKVYSAVEPKRVNGVPLSGPMLVQLIENYCEILNGNEGRVGPQQAISAWRGVVQTQLRSGLREAVGIYRSILSEEGMKKLPLGDAQLVALNNRAKTEAKTAFPSALLRALELNATGDALEAATDVNQSISVAEVDSADLFYREFKIRKTHLIDHLKAENTKVGMKELERVWQSCQNNVSSFVQYVTESRSIPQALITVFLVKTVIPVVSQSARPTSPVQRGPIVSSDPNLTELVSAALAELRSADAEKRSIQIRAENEKNLIDLERKFNKQLNEARRKNELLIDNLKTNYEQEALNLRAQRTELQNMIHALEKQNLEQYHQIEKLNQEKSNANIAETVQKQASIVLQYLQSKENSVIPQSSVPRPAIDPSSPARPPLIGRSFVN